MTWYGILLLVLASLIFISLLFLLIAALKLVRMLSYPIRYTTEFTYQTDLKKGILGGIEVLKREKVVIPMSDGYLIQGDVSLHEGKEKFVIITHGYTWTREGSLKYAKIFYKLGYSVLMYDLRSHGENVHKDVTMGFKEAKDLHEIILWVRAKYGKDTPIGLHGESMGAATSLLALNYQDKLDFCVADSSYSSLKELCAYKIIPYHLPKAVLPLCSLLLLIFHGYSFKDIEVADAVKKTKVPLLLIHGESDTFVPIEEAKELQKANPASKLVFFPHSEHAKSVIDHPDAYEKTVAEFISSLK
jgi:alpha-beta hydrolase superfamily lysophospholipase